MCLYKELFICFEISLRQIPKSEIYGARNIFMVINVVLPSGLHYLARLLSVLF